MGESTGSEHTHLPRSAPPRNHGNTPAAWVTVIVVMVGGLMGVLGVMFTVAALFWAGLVVVAIGLVVGRVMRMLGLGQPVEQTTRAAEQG